MSDLERLLAFVCVEENGCWSFTGCIKDCGYGEFKLNGISEKAHRASWTLHKGPIPIGIWVLHKCDYRPCINPDHLFLGNAQDNTDDMEAKGRNAYAAVGSNNAYAKLNEDKVRLIKQRLREGVLHRKIGLEFGIARTTVTTISRGESWSHVE